VLVVAVFVVFGQATSFEFVTYDDPVLVYDNPHIVGGLNAESVVWALTSFHLSNWHPLTSLSHILDWEMWGNDPGGHHLTSVVLHAAAVVMLFLAFRRLTGNLWPSALVAVLFAVHPLRAESVAWVAERKDVLSGLMWMTVLYAWGWYVKKPRVGRYAVVAGLYVLGLASKPMVVTLPFVLLLLDVWPLGRLQIGQRGSSSAEPVPTASIGRQTIRLVLEKLPLMLLAAGCAAVTVVAQRGAMEQLGPLGFGVRVANALVAWVAYVQKTVAPICLAMFYPHPGSSLPVWQPVAAAVVLIAVTAAVVIGIKRRPYLAVGWFWYLGTLVPVIGLVQVGSQAMADRYTYIPQIGVWLMLAWSLAELWNLRVRSRPVIAGAVCVVIVTTMVVARRQVGFWKDSATLNRHALECTTRNWLAHANLAGILVEQGRNTEAALQAKASLAIRPDNPVPMVYLGRALEGLGRPREAAVQFERALEHVPGSTSILLDLGTALADAGDHHGARARYRQALETDPGSLPARNNLGTELLRAGDFEEAAALLCAAEVERSDDLLLHFNCGVALTALQRYDDAVVQFRRAVEIDPRHVQSWRALASALERSGRLDQAIEALRAAQRLSPDDEAVRRDLERLSQLQRRS
jgi:Flp pilus assembly protein TadD